MLGPLLFNIFTADLPEHKTLLATFTDDTTLLTDDKNPVIASFIIQDHLNSIFDWASGGQVEKKN